jgi:hypothetical protein
MQGTASRLLSLLTMTLIRVLVGSLDKKWPKTARRGRTILLSDNSPGVRAADDINFARGHNISFFITQESEERNASSCAFPQCVLKLEDRNYEHFLKVRRFLVLRSTLSSRYSLSSNCHCLSNFVGQILYIILYHAKKSKKKRLLLRISTACCQVGRSKLNYEHFLKVPRFLVLKSTLSSLPSL